MKIQQIQELTDATVACGNDKLGHEVQCAFASDLKKATPEMLQLASENNMILLETCHSMYHVAGELYCSGLVPVY